MLTLKIFAPSIGMKSPSPFSMKAIALLEMSGVGYETKPGDPRKEPKQKLPVLIDNGKIIPDSTIIQAHLKNAHGFDPDSDLSINQLAIAEAFRRMVEDHLYWVMVYSRWIEHPDYIRDAFFTMIPSIIRKFIFNKIVKQVRANLYGQGMGRHSRDEIYRFGATDLKALSDYLGDKDYFFGDKPTSIDASIYGILSCMLVPPIETPLKDAALGMENLVAYHARFEQNFNMKAYSQTVKF